MARRKSVPTAQHYFPWDGATLFFVTGFICWIKFRFNERKYLIKTWFALVFRWRGEQQRRRGEP